MDILEERFQNLIKKRVYQESVQQPILFPWEDPNGDLEMAYLDDLSELCVPSPSLLNTSQDSLGLNFHLPQDVFQEVLMGCNRVLGYLKPTGAKLVQAVQDLFPQGGAELNQLTNSLRLSTVRHPEAVLPQAPAYGEATEQQRMLMSLLAAQSIFSRLTLSLSPEQPELEQRWEIQGEEIAAIAQVRGKGVEIQVDLPRGGQVSWKGDHCQGEARRDNAGVLALYLWDLEDDRPYPVNIKFDRGSDASFRFMVMRSGFDISA